MMSSKRQQAPCCANFPASVLSWRYGGEEFVLLFPGSSADKAAALAETIREGIIELQIPHAYSRTHSMVTVSAGVAGCIPCRDMNPEELLSQADVSLYKAKNSGRNQVVTHAAA